MTLQLTGSTLESKVEEFFLRLASLVTVSCVRLRRLTCCCTHCH